MITYLLIFLNIFLQVVFILRALLRTHREPSSRLAWVVVILAIPAVGVLAYILFGETNIGHRRAERYRKTVELLRAARTPYTTGDDGKVPSHRAHLFDTGKSISGMSPVEGNTAELLADSDTAIDTIVADMDAAEKTVHLLFYIWLTDTNGTKIVDAAIRAAQRGVKVRAMADDIGSRLMIKSEQWTEMEKAGVHVMRALPVSNPVLHPIRGRVDLRNHRKIVVIDSQITYCGSQNCSDPAFAIKAKYAPWVDLMVRFEGPIAQQNEMLFISDWMTHVDEDLRHLVQANHVPHSAGGVMAQVIGTGPTVRPTAMPEMFEALMHAARDELIVTTPYFVPTESMQSALCAAARRGVHTVIVFPKRNDSWIVAAASQSYYEELVEAGVRVYEYPLGLLHSKSLTIDGEMSLIGSANLDRRSFELNYENNILIEDDELTAALRERQQEYIDASQPLDTVAVMNQSVWHRLKCNVIAMMGPVL